MSDRKCATFGAILAASLSFCASTGAAAEPPGELSLRDAVATLFATYERAWGRSDAKALAATYTSRGDLRIPTGRIFSGRSSIEAFYAGASRAATAKRLQMAWYSGFACFRRTSPSSTGRGRSDACTSRAQRLTTSTEHSTPLFFAPIRPGSWPRCANKPSAITEPCSAEHSAAYELAAKTALARFKVRSASKSPLRRTTNS